MLEVLFIVVGTILLLLAIGDFATTAFVPTGEGWVTALVGRSIYWTMMSAARHRGRSAILNYTGSVIIFATLAVWVLLLWAGFSLIYLSDKNSVLLGTDESATDTFEKIYHVGYTLSTLGIGDYVPGSNFWRVFTSFVSFVGLITITMSITYLVPVISNAIHKRSLSLQISSLGETPEEIVISSFNGKDFKDIESTIGKLASEIFLFSQNQVAYPILHHMHSNNPSENIVLKLAALDEAVGIFTFHVPDELQPNQLQLQSVRRAITAYLKTISYMKPATKQPPLPRFHIIEDYTSGVSLERTDDPYCKEVYRAVDQRRRLLYADVQNNGWVWEDMHGEKYVSDLDATYNNELIQS